ncbi:MAG: Flp pilus assembly complex ATPase component TadA, partial [Phycisphaerae bacterium]|nr:Flp pilus assembly complex ATPase component TadA [Phycisphaerae bacterium]
MLLWLFMGSFVAGLVVYSLAVAAVGAGYVVYRNQRVDVEYRILTPDHIRSLMGGGARDKLPVRTLLKVYDADGKILPPPGDDAPIEQQRAYNLGQQLLYDILFYRASEADLSPVGAVGRVRFVVDGALLARPDLDQGHCELVIQYLKGVTSMDPAETRRPQKGALSVDLASQRIDMVVTTAGTTTGQRMQFRVVQESIQTRLEDLGISEDMLDRICELNAEPTGLLIISSKPKNGLSSTLYSLMRRHDAFTKQLIALEAQAASDLENVSQNIYGSQDDLAKALAAAIRQEPGVIMVDRCENTEAAGILAEAADKRLILLGVSAGSSLTAMAKWVRAAGRPATAMSNLRGIVSQVLIRKLCPQCKEGYAPDPAVLAKVNLPLGSIESFYRPPTGPLLDDKGKAMLDKQGLPIPCPTCGGTGYFGRTGVFELLEI